MFTFHRRPVILSLSSLLPLAALLATGCQDLRGDASRATGPGADASGDGEAGESDEGPSANDENGDGPSSIDSGDSGDGDGDGDGDSEDGDIPDLRFDLGSLPDGDPPCDSPDLRFIWIANSNQGTVSKIDTVTGIELGRYWTDPAMNANSSPSRTSVNLMGDVAVSNRNIPGTTKFAALEERCIDRNGNGTIETSSGSMDILPWGEEECMLWHTEFPEATGGSRGPRPTQWEGGKLGGSTCQIDPNPRLWVGYAKPDGAYFHRLDGATGAILDTAHDPDWSPNGFGPYGGVVNAAGDLWSSGLGGEDLLHIDAQSLKITRHENPGVNFYGIGIDAKGNPWIAGTEYPGKVAIFDDAAQKWDIIQLSATGALRGIQVDREGRAWAAANSPCALVEFDVETRTPVNENIELPGCSIPVGVSVDAEGKVWLPDQTQQLAYKVHPTDYTVELVVEGLVGPYTYSDMTGASLGLVTDPPSR